MLNKEITNWILLKVNSGNFSFHDLLDKLKENIKIKNKNASFICAYYCANVILKNRNMNDIEKSRIISDISESLNLI